MSRAPLATIGRYRAERGSTFPWYSSSDSDFDYHVTLDVAVTALEFNFRAAPELVVKGWDWMPDWSIEHPGYSIFLAVDAQIFHTNSVFARGTEWLGGSYAFLDLTALGRQEDWERPEGHSDLVRGAVPNFSN